MKGKHGTLVIIGLLLVLVPWMVIRLGTNLDGLRALAICAGNLNTTTPEQPFFQGGAARCQEDMLAARAAYRLALDEPNARLEVIQAVFPADVEMAQTAVTSYPENAKAYFWLSTAFVQTNDIPAAVSTYEAGLVLDPTNGNAWDEVARLYENDGNWDLAVHAFEQACHYVDQGKNGCPNAARLYMERAQYEEAILRYQDTLIQLPGFEPALRGLVEAFSAMGRPKEAVPYLESLADLGDKEAQAKLDEIESLP